MGLELHQDEPIVFLSFPVNVYSSEIVDMALVSVPCSLANLGSNHVIKPVRVCPFFCCSYWLVRFGLELY